MRPDALVLYQNALRPSIRVLLLPASRSIGHKVIVNIFINQYCTIKIPVFHTLGTLRVTLLLVGGLCTFRSSVQKCLCVIV